MSLTVELKPPVCEYCGSPIEDEDQFCPACEDSAFIVDFAEVDT